VVASTFAVMKSKSAGESSENSAAASAAKLLRRAGIYSPTDEENLNARASARLEYIAHAKAAVRS
jgi:hypothetical protein